MKKYLILYAVIVSLLLAQVWRHYRAENKRLETNQEALMSDVAHYRTRNGQEVAAKEVLQLRVSEFERLRASDAAVIRDLGIKLRRVEATAKTATATLVELRAALRDTVVMRPPTDAPGPIIPDTLRAFRWRDPWVTIEGLVGRDSVECRVLSVDTLRQVIHRVPKKFWFIRWGTKAIRQEIISSNPHTRVVYAEYVKFDK